MPRCSDLAIFWGDRQTDRRTDRTDYITPCACARGKYWVQSSSLNGVGGAGHEIDCACSWFQSEC